MATRTKTEDLASLCDPISGWAPTGRTAALDHWSNECLAMFALSRLEYLHPLRQRARNLLMSAMNPEVVYCTEEFTIAALREATLALRAAAKEMKLQRTSL